MVVRFTCWTDIAAPVDLVFDLSSSIDEHLGSMRGFGERAVAGVTSGQIGPGQRVTWQARHFGIRWRMTSRVIHFQRPALFVDEQVSGPSPPFVTSTASTPSHAAEAPARARGSWTSWSSGRRSVRWAGSRRSWRCAGTCAI
jgi:hypothetical protein